MTSWLRNFPGIAAAFTPILCFSCSSGTGIHSGAFPDTPITATRGLPIADSVLLPWMEAYRVQGLSIAVIADDRIDWAKGYGVLEKGSAVPVTERTLFQTASMGKPVTATCALMLYDRLGISLDEDIRARLESWTLRSDITFDTPPTMRQILSHTAGFNVHGFLGYLPSDTLPTLSQILDGAPPANNRPITVYLEPGTRWVYSGGGYVVAQQILEDATGEGFAQLVQENIFGPLGMTQTSYLDPLNETDAVSGHQARTDADDVQVMDGRWRRFPDLATGSIWTTPSDFAKFVIALQRSHRGEADALLPRDVARMQMSPQAVIDSAERMGLGVWLSGSAFSHAGGIPGANAKMYARLDKRFGVVVMTNTEPGREILQQIIDAIEAAY
jgi:CubicO group peptidase (beta-lactamase class C family)